MGGLGLVQKEQTGESGVKIERKNACLREKSNPFVLRLPHRQLKYISSSFLIRLEVRFLDALIHLFAK